MEIACYTNFWPYCRVDISTNRYSQSTHQEPSASCIHKWMTGIVYFHTIARNFFDISRNWNIISKNFRFSSSRQQNLSWFRFGQTSCILCLFLDTYREKLQGLVGLAPSQTGLFSEGNLISVLFEIWHLWNLSNSTSAAYRLSKEGRSDFMRINNLR